MDSKSRFNKFAPLASDKVQELKDVLHGKKEVEEQHDGEHAEEAQLPEADRSNLEAEISVLQEKLKKSEEASGEFREKHLRTLAEFDNFRKRMEREKEEMVKYSNEKLVNEFLPVLDHLEMTIEHASKADNTGKKGSAIEEGVRLVVKQFFGVLEKFGIEAVGKEKEKFDPHRHEAIATVDSTDHEPGAIVQVHRKGFVLNGRLIRPAMVTIAKAPETSATDEDDDSKEENTVH